MDTGEQIRQQGRVSESDGRAELERLLSDSRFHGTERSRSILRYLAERHFRGCDEAVKAYAIAVDVLGRHASFDATSDPIVRIEMSRLRSCLSQYYEAFGSDSEVSINLPVGRYVSVFSRDDKVDADEEPAAAWQTTDGVDDAPIEPREQERLSPSNGRRFQGMHKVGTAALAAVLIGSGGAAWYASRPAMTTRPSVTIAMSSTRDGIAIDADTTADYLLTALSKFRTLNIASQKNMPTGSVSQRARAFTASTFDIDMKYYADDGSRAVWWQVIDNRSGHVLKSGVDRVESDGRGEVALRDELVSKLAKRFASTRGVISLLETQDGSTRTLGNSCVLKAEYGLDEGGRTGIRNAMSCLERTVEIQPDNSDALAVLSRIVVAAEGGNPATTHFDRALALANRAASLDPASDRAQVAIMMAQFYMGHTDAAIAAGNQALALNPNNPDVLSKLAGVLYSSGYPEAAVSLAEDAGKGVDAMPRDARIVLALDAYSRGDYSTASLVSEQINCGDIVVRAIRAAALGEMASPAAKASLDYLSAALPDYRTSLGEWLGWRRYPAPVIAALEKGLTKAATVGSVSAVN